MSDNPTKHVIVEIDDTGAQPIFRIDKRLIGEREMGVGAGRTCTTVEEATEVTKKMINEWLKIEL